MRFPAVEPLFHSPEVVLQQVGYQRILVFLQSIGYDRSNEISEKTRPGVRHKLSRAGVLALHHDGGVGAALCRAQGDDGLASNVRRRVPRCVVVQHILGTQALVELEQSFQSEASPSQLLHHVLPVLVRLPAFLGPPSPQEPLPGPPPVAPPRARGRRGPAAGGEGAGEGAGEGEGRKRVCHGVQYLRACEDKGVDPGRCVDVAVEGGGQWPQHAAPHPQRDQRQQARDPKGQHPRALLVEDQRQAPGLCSLAARGALGHPNSEAPRVAEPA
mmetsp:Transcript_154793/g.375856  ORF Transcript_154793/g.375856 Transcript_154793/m.375856 type:complete len:272 (+) Transcript_154793:679-1494(+)